MPDILLGKNDKIYIKLPLFDGDYKITGMYRNSEILSTKDTLAVEYHTLLDNLKHRHCYLVRLTQAPRLPKEEPLVSTIFILASNIDDFSIYILDLKKKYQQVEVKQITGFTTEDVTLISVEDLKRRGLLPSSY
jgi:hypothetical protein